MSKGGSNSNTYKYICKKKYKLLIPSNYKYNYNLKYMKICARHKLKHLKPPSCTTRPPLTFTGPHYKPDLRAPHAQ